MSEIPPLVIVTGAGSGLGRAFCRRLAESWHGCHFVVVDVDEAAARQTLADLTQTGSATGVCESFDVSEGRAWFDLRERLQRERPRLDLLVNSAGVCMSAEVGDGDLAAWRRVHEVNFFGVLNGCQTMAPWLKGSAANIARRKPGVLASAGRAGPPLKPAVINIASIMGLLPSPSIGAYSASKAAVVALSEAMYAELRPHGVYVTVAAPGFFASSLLDRGDFASTQHRAQADDLVRSSSIDADAVARETLAASAAGRPYAIMGSRARAFWRLKRLAPITVLNSLARRYERMMKASASGDRSAD